MKLLALTVAAVLCAVLLQQTTGAATGRTAEQSLLASKLGELSKPLMVNSSSTWSFPGYPPVQAPQTHIVSYASKKCYNCESTQVDGIYSDGDRSCDDPFPGGAGVTLEQCSLGSCMKLVRRLSGGGSKRVDMIRKCMVNCGTQDLKGKWNDFKATIVQTCCTIDKCNGTPSVNYTSKIVVSSIGLILTVFYSY